MAEKVCWRHLRHTHDDHKYAEPHLRPEFCRLVFFSSIARLITPHFLALDLFASFMHRSCIAKALYRIPAKSKKRVLQKRKK